ncbi:MAG: hypothetical protein BWZ06_01942 [Bacteroidetes bacterium ADurb.BinA261]|nr:MAG: hypothetical protein BWZ06_01942 [Bacteroidetes bacterium ADurb.BinA261]
MPITHFAFERSVLNGFIEPLLKGLNEYLFPCRIEQTLIEFIFEMLFLKLFFVQKFENHPIHQYRFKDFRYIERQRITAVSRRMQITDRRVELRLMNRSQALRIAHHIAKRNQRIHFVFRRLLTSSTHAEIVEDKFETLVIGLPYVAFQSHHFVNGFRIGKHRGILLNFFDYPLQILTARIIITQVFGHVESRTFHKFSCQFEPPFFTLIS